MDNISKDIRFIEPVIHILVWAVFFGFPLLLMTNESSEIDWNRMLHHTIVPVSFCIVFYLNYFLFIPRFLFRDSTRLWVIINIVTVLLSGVVMQMCQVYLRPPEMPGSVPHFRFNPGILFFLRDVFSLVLVVGIAAAVQLGRRWMRAERARREAEKQVIEAERRRTEAELKNLRNQLNPHFILNTLNNIYALIAFDTDRAQATVSDLSRLLRYVLYDNQQDTVPLSKEIDFIRNYIALMRIRLTDDVTLTTDIEVSDDSRTEIAPLLFISLIENAFKHGVAPVGRSFISVSISETPEEIRCDIANSCHPKASSDKSGSGIGLEHLRKRLGLIYPGRYEWNYGPDTDRSVYRSVLIIKK